MKKSPELRQNRATNDVGIVAAPLDVPTPPRGLATAARRIWDDYWADSRSGAVGKADRAVVERWINNVNRYQTLIKLADGAPVSQGSQGQLIANPFYKLALSVETSIREDEKQLGIGALNALKLGIAKGEATRSLADLNAEADNGEDSDDFRLTLIQDDSVAN